MRKTITVPVRQEMPADELVEQLTRARDTHEGQAKAHFDLKSRWIGYGAGEQEVTDLQSVTLTWED